MEKKKNIWDINTLWSLFSHRNFGGNFFQRIFPTKLSPNGFTLIEILIAIALIGIMAVGIITALNPLAQFQKAQDAKRKGDLSQIQKAVETYYQDNGRYPASSAVAPIYRIKRLDGTTADWGTQFQPYMSILPKDPSSPSKNYVYFSSNNPPSNGQTYYLYVSLDRGTNDPQACMGGFCQSLSSNGISYSACGELNGDICDYGVSSSNVSP